MGQKALILIVDDDHAIQEALSEYLVAHGFATASFSSGASLLGFPRLSEARCLILDIEMPGMSGLEIYAKLLESGKRIPVIFITAYPRAAARAQTVSLGAEAFIEKPFDSRVLLKLIRKVIRNRRSNGNR